MVQLLYVFMLAEGILFATSGLLWKGLHLFQVYIWSLAVVFATIEMLSCFKINNEHPHYITTDLYKDGFPTEKIKKNMFQKTENNVTK